MGKKVLIVEDDTDIIQLITLYVENEGIEVYTANNGLEALVIMEQTKIDLAVIDIMMPQMDGFTLIKRIRGFSNIPIIILSAKIMDSDKILGLNLGADDYLTKPFNPLEVVARIKANLRRYYQLNENKAAGLEPCVLRVGALTLEAAHSPPRDL